MRASALALGVSLFSPAYANNDVLVLEEVLVTASRRIESLQETPMSVSAFTSDFLQDTGVNGLDGLDLYTPNLKIVPGADSRSTSIRIRGIGSVGTNSGIDPSVGVFIDGIYQGRAGMSISDLVDVQRVEVLRGPQGTLYGKNTAAGAITVTTFKPGLEFESEIELEYDSNEKASARGMVNVPFGESGHAMRLSGFYIDGDHLYENSVTGEGLNDAHKWGGRARTLLDFTNTDSGDFGEWIITLDYTNEDTDCCAFAVTDYNGLSTLNSPGTNDPSAEYQQQVGMNAMGDYIMQFFSLVDSTGIEPPEPDPFGDDYWVDGDIGNKVEVGGVALEWNRDLANDDSLTFLNAWRHYESDSVYDGDFTAWDAVLGSTDVELDQYSSELRITSPGGATFDYQGGLYAYYAEFDSVGEFEMSQTLVENIQILPGITLDAFLPNGSLNTDTNTYKTTSFAGFGEVVWNISDDWNLVLGARYTWEKKERDGSQITTPAFDFEAPPVAGPDIYYDESRTDSDVSPAAKLRYYFNQDVMGYASVSRGFKSGGFNQRREISGNTGEFDEETATNYEIGWKGTWLDRRLQVNGTIYYIDYDDFQAQAFDGSDIRVTNAGSMESYGSELEVIFLPIADLTVGTAIGYNKAEYGEFKGGQCTVQATFDDYYFNRQPEDGPPSVAPGSDGSCKADLGGEALDNAPEWTVSSYAQYEQVLGDDLLGVVRVEHNYIDEFYLDQDLDENLVNDAVDIVNLRFTLMNEARDWEVILWGRNLLDEEYFAFGIDIPTLGGYAGVVAPEATYGVTLRFFN